MRDELLDEFEETRTRSEVLQWGPPLLRADTPLWVRRIVTDLQTYRGVAEAIIANSPGTRSRRRSSAERKKWYERWQFLRTCGNLRGYVAMFVRFSRQKSLVVPFLPGDGDELLGHQAAREAKEGIVPPRFVMQPLLWREAIELVDQRNEAAKKSRGRQRFSGDRRFIAAVRAYCRVFGGQINWGASR